MNKVSLCDASIQTGLAAGTDAIEAARSAGLRYTVDGGPGITRHAAPNGFVYYAPDGTQIADAEVLERIRRLALPPAWQNVWICPHENGHLQATGRDARGRKQYRYHAQWRTVRDETKFARMAIFGRRLARLRARVEADLAKSGMPREKVLALVVRLLETTLIRVGNEEYARQNKSFGLTTMRNRHVHLSGSAMVFEFRGKSGKWHSVRLEDRRLARIMRNCLEIPGQELFQYVDADGHRQSIDSSDVNHYLHEISGHDFTAKDFRTWGGTVRALMVFSAMASAESRPSRQHVNMAVKCVARQLGNTPAVCRKYYIHPIVIEAFENGRLSRLRIPDASKDEGRYLDYMEKTVIRLLYQSTQTHSPSP